jgi:CDP-diacylglycerol--glycerol-3-phosphate 3-phosphatidyltransferase
MAISRGSDGPVEVEPIAAATPKAAPVLSRHALRTVAEAPAELEVEVSPPPKPAPALAPVAPTASRSAPAGDPGRFWNLPNSITVLRAAAVPVLLFYPLFSGEFGSTVMAWIFIVAAVSDLVDGWLARRGQQVTHIGVLLDPLADKLVVSTALIVLLAMDRMPEWWATAAVVTIVGRELAVTGLRGIASAGGQIVGASSLGKLKTVAQNIAVGALLFHYQTLGLDAHFVGMVFLFAATALTIASGYRYFADYFRGLARAGR